MQHTSSNEIDVVINGEPARIPEGLTILDVLSRFGLDPARVALEFDGSIMKSREWAGTIVHDGARLEIVTFVGGG